MAEESKDIKVIFSEAIVRENPEERKAYLDQACQGDQKLRAEIEELLEAHVEAADFLEPRAFEASATMDNNPSIEGPGTRIGHYELLELIGEGGMGLVYLAEQKEPVRRKVVLKVIKPGMDSKQVIARFEAERQALAVLDHPNIAHVFDAGTTETGRPYFVMEYVKGMSITRYCDERKLNIEQRLRLFEQVCEGVHHAHQKGIIHRDLKPSNILVSVHGDRAVPKIIDFGIAKAITQPLTDKTFVTFQGQLLGTPEYMSPEQVDFATQDIDTRSDIYSLGVVLYELLAGVLPFEEDSFARAGFDEIQRTIREQEPASPSIRLTSLGEKAKLIAASRGTQVVPLARRLHRELEWIPLKAMRKDRCRRYRSAFEMADDIHNYLTGRPLIAGPETAIYRVQKFVRKHAGSVATVALVAVAIVLGLVVSTAMYIRAERMRVQADQARQKEFIARTEAEQATRKEAAARIEADQARTQAEQAKNAEQEQRKLAENRAEALRRSLYVNSIQLADAKYREGNAKQVRTLLDSCPDDLRGWEWNRLAYIQDQSIMTLRAHDGFRRAMALSPDGRHIISGGGDGTIKVWDSATGEEIQTLRGHEGAVQSLAVSPDGKRIISGGLEDATIKIWDTETGEELRTIRGHQSGLSSVTCSADGALLASASFADHSVKIWNITTGANVMILPTGKDDIECVAFSPDGKYLASARGEGEVKIWDLSTGLETMTIGDAHAPVTFSPDSRWLVSGGDWNGLFRVWDVTTGSLGTAFRGYHGPVSSVVFSPDGTQIAGDSGTNTIRIWDAETGDELKTLRGHAWVVGAVAFGPNNDRLVSGSWDGTVKVWNLNVDCDEMRLQHQGGTIRSVTFSPDGKHVASGNSKGVVELWDVKTGTELMTLQEATAIPQRTCVVFSPDGRRIAAGGHDRELRIWDASTGSLEMRLGGHEGVVGALAFSPDGKLVASGCRGKMVKIWDVAGHRELVTFKADESRVLCIAFSPDGRSLASGGFDPTIKIWDSSTWRQYATLQGHSGTVNSIAFSPDGKRMVSSCQGDGSVKVWDLISQTELLMLHGHSDLVTSVTFSPDGKRIISGSRDGTAKIWDATTGTELLTLHAQFQVFSVAFSLDGKTLAVGGTNGTIVIWESSPPGEGYEARKIGADAMKLVDELHQKYGFYHDSISQLLGNVTLVPSVQKLALQTVNSRKWEDVDRLVKEAREIVSLPDKANAEYRVALTKAQQANSWEPNDPAILITLAAVQYRVGSYENTLKTLTKSEGILSDAGEDPDPWNLVFKGMALHRVGRTEEAKAALEQLRELCKKEAHLAWDMEVQGLLAEAERLIAGERP